MTLSPTARTALAMASMLLVGPALPQGDDPAWKDPTDDREAAAKIRAERERRKAEAFAKRDPKAQRAAKIAAIQAQGAARKRPWGEQKWSRAGDCDCAVCGKLYSKHPRERGPGYGMCSDTTLTLYRLCNGDLVKL